MKMQAWELKEALDKLVETHGDSVWLDALIEFRDKPSGGVHVRIDEGEELS